MLAQAMLCFVRSSFRRSMVWSASALTASCTWTSSTRWLPPFRSSPSRMLFFEVLHQLGLRLGEADDAENAQQDRRNNDHGPRRQILLHGN